MSIADISPAAVLHEIRAGHHTVAALANEFGVLPGSKFLADALRELVDAGLVVVHDGGVIHPNDLVETLPHDAEKEN